ncbi:hypothetical protein LguiA_035647 [Lonicera macranthoides]
MAKETRDFLVCSAELWQLKYSLDSTICRAKIILPWLGIEPATSMSQTKLHTNSARYFIENLFALYLYRSVRPVRAQQLFCRIKNILSWPGFEPCTSGLLEHDESYQMLRNRKRRQVYLHDYAEEYYTTTDYGKLVIQQQLHIVHWIIERVLSTGFCLQVVNIFKPKE